MAAVELGVALAGNAKKIGWPKEPEDVALMAAMGGSKLATGISILVLDELRKRAAYTFKGKRKLPIGPGGTDSLERIEFPVVDLVEEV
ncbi:unnamed protein product [marine sediment metagenome]|uniref:Uncharacterized protein n=1 Tax=marine sediment metagenome TaxID=412755 RepID=X1LJ37_9ZZZZ